MKNKVVTRKRKRNNEETEEKQQKIKKLRKENKVKRFRNELKLPIKDNEKLLLEELDEMKQNEKIENIKRLVEKYLDLRDINSRVIWKWFYLGRDFEQKVNRRINQEREKSEQTVKKEIYNEMMEFLMKKNEDDEIKKNKKKALKEKIRGAKVIYELFMKIGQERINNVKETNVTTIIKLTVSQKNQIIKDFRKKHEKEKHKEDKEEFQIDPSCLICYKVKEGTEPEWFKKFWRIFQKVILAFSSNEL
ncbi:hypothetical protein RhiirA4_483328 [Rhizophagus irregularis]|uniref:Uncharacterized protein n=1 Tax=Rhizophagus irregularis TaxID=588596 RepID=A0A2I1HME8_9GLOM|nr:hypothetical protein RhiirA4_483328 [Rhizophagus irregularis]